MEPVKIENYERGHGPGTFIPFRHLSDDEANGVLGLLRCRLGLATGLSPREVVAFVQDKGVVARGVNAQSDDFSLRQVLTDFHFNAADTVYLNWYRFDRIDEVQIVDLFRIFGDIWYPSSDDLDIIDSSMDWLLSIDHGGTVRALRLGEKVDVTCDARDS